MSSRPGLAALATIALAGCSQILGVQGFSTGSGSGSDGGVIDAPPSTDAPGSTPTTTQLIPTSVDIDLLFVIDNSPSTSDKQAAFLTNFTSLVQALDGFPTGRPNVHIGVVSTSVDVHTQGFGAGCPSPNTTDDGRLQNTARITLCAPPADHYLSDVSDGSGGRTVNYTGALGDAFSCIADLGTPGCGFEAPLEAMKKALDGSLTENTGFVRPGAFLAVVILTDEDDCSAKDYSLFDLDESVVGPSDFRCQPFYAYQCDHPISATAADTYKSCQVRTGSYLQDTTYYHDFLAGLKAPGQVMVAVIGGDPTSDVTMTGALTMPFAQTLALLPSCNATINGNYAIGRPGIRLNDFVQQFEGRGLYESVCQADYSHTLVDIGTLVGRAVSPCLPSDVDARDRDPANPGVQPDCTVTDVVGINTSSRTDTPIPACAMTDATTPSASGPRPCWWAKPDPTTCATAPSLSIQVERTAAPAAGLDVQVTCAVQP